MEPIVAGMQAHHELKGETIEFKTDFQTATISTTAALGKILTLDGYMQSAENDEHLYVCFFSCVICRPIYSYLNKVTSIMCIVITSL